MPWRLVGTFGTNYVTEERAQGILVVMHSADCVLSIIFLGGTQDSLNMGSVFCHPNVHLVDQIEIFFCSPKQFPISSLLLRVRDC